MLWQLPKMWQTMLVIWMLCEKTPLLLCKEACPLPPPRLLTVEKYGMVVINSNSHCKLLSNTHKFISWLWTFFYILLHLNIFSYKLVPCKSYSVVHSMSIVVSIFSCTLYVNCYINIDALTAINLMFWHGECQPENILYRNVLARVVNY